MFDEEDGSGLGGGLFDDTLVEIPAKVGFGGFELEAGGIHLAEDLVEVAGFGLGVEGCRREREGEGGTQKRCSNVSD